MPTAPVPAPHMLFDMGVNMNEHVPRDDVLFTVGKGAKRKASHPIHPTFVHTHCDLQSVAAKVDMFCCWRGATLDHAEAGWIGLNCNSKLNQKRETPFVHACFSWRATPVHGSRIWSTWQRCRMLSQSVRCVHVKFVSIGFNCAIEFVFSQLRVSEADSGQPGARSWQQYGPCYAASGVGSHLVLLLWLRLVLPRAAGPNSLDTNLQQVQNRSNDMWLRHRY